MQNTRIAVAFVHWNFVVVVVFRLKTNKKFQQANYFYPGGFLRVSMGCGFDGGQLVFNFEVFSDTSGL